MDLNLTNNGSNKAHVHFNQMIDFLSDASKVKSSDKM